MIPMQVQIKVSPNPQPATEASDYFGTIRWHLLSPTWTPELTLEGFERSMVEWDITHDVNKDTYSLTPSRGTPLTDTKESIFAKLEMGLCYYVEDVTTLERCYVDRWEGAGASIKQPYLMIQIIDGEVRVKPSIILDDVATGYRNKVLMFAGDQDPSKILYQYVKGTDILLTASYDEALNYLKGV